MKHIKLLAALETLDKIETKPEKVTAATTTGEAPAAKPVNWQAEYNKLRSQVLRLRTQLREALNPSRTDAEMEHDLKSVAAFCKSMALAEGAVTCANIYNAKFFDTEKDTRYVVALCQYLVERYRTNSTLIEGTYRLWTNKANA